MLNEIAQQQLKKAGWYPGRKIDIIEQMRYLEKLGYEVFDAAVKFLEEFSDLDIVDKSTHIIDGEKIILTREIKTCVEKFYSHRKITCNLNEEVGEMTIPIIEYDGEVIMFISESGSIFRDVGMIAQTTEQFWNEVYGGDFGIILEWADLKSGKQRKMAKKSIRKYI